jgi:hypothetical protein
MMVGRAPTSPRQNPSYNAPTKPAEHGGVAYGHRRCCVWFRPRCAGGRLALRARPVRPGPRPGRSSSGRGSMGHQVVDPGAALLMDGRDWRIAPPTRDPVVGGRLAGARIRWPGFGGPGPAGGLRRWRFGVRGTLCLGAVGRAVAAARGRRWAVRRHGGGLQPAGEDRVLGGPYLPLVVPESAQLLLVTLAPPGLSLPHLDVLRCWHDS